MLNLTRQERLVLQFLALFFVIGIAIHLIRERAGVAEGISISASNQDARNFRTQGEKVDSAYFAARKKEKEESDAPVAATEKQRINLNSATLEDLMILPKIGEVTAKRIIEYRATHGGFKSIEELINVKGIGAKTLERIKNEVSIE